ncbi:MAG: ATP-binding protein [Alphaproteobacteria bacterium]
MKLAFIELCGFRGYRKQVRVDFGERFTIIDGRNGVGKSTIFDAVEFALTGTISKYDEAKADGETIADYIWWKGEGPPPDAFFVNVGFHDGEEIIDFRRGAI